MLPNAAFRAEVYLAVQQNADSSTHFLDKAKHLSVIHKAPPELWSILVTFLVKQGRWAQ